MANRDARLARAERHAPKLPALTLFEDMDTAGVYRVEMYNPPAGVVNGDTFTRDDLPALEKRYNVLVLSWATDPEPVPGAIRISWEDAVDGDYDD